MSTPALGMVIGVEPFHIILKMIVPTALFKLKKMVQEEVVGMPLGLPNERMSRISFECPLINFLLTSSLIRIELSPKYVWTQVLQHCSRRTLL